jgi:hypothetical protein
LQLLCSVVAASASWMGAATSPPSSCNCSRLGHSLGSASVGTSIDGDHPCTTGSEEAVCIAHGCDKSAHSCSTVSARFGVYRLRPLWLYCRLMSLWRFLELLDSLLA